MKKISLLFVFLLLYVFSHSQSLGYAFYDPKLFLETLNETEKPLLNDCMNLIGVKIDSIKMESNTLDKSKIRNSKYNVLYVSRSTIPVMDLDTKEMKTTIISNYFRNPNFDKPKFMFFLVRNNDLSQIIVQMYY